MRILRIFKIKNLSFLNTKSIMIFKYLKSSNNLINKLFFKFMLNNFKFNKNIFFFFVILISIIVKYILLKTYHLPSFFDAQSYIFQGKIILGKIPSLNYKDFSDVMMPLYPIILYYAQETIGVQNFNIIISTLNIISIYKIAQILVPNNKNYSKLILIIVAFYPNNIFYSITTFSENFYIFFLINFFLFFLLKKPYTGGLFAIIGILVKASHELIIPFLIIFFYIFIYKKNIKNLLKPIFIFILLYILILSPWWLFNYKKYETFVRTNFSSSMVLFIGNNSSNKTGGGVIIDENDVKKFPERFQKVQKDFDYEIFKGEPGFATTIYGTVGFKENPSIKEKLHRYASMEKKGIIFIFSEKKKFLHLAYLKFLRFWALVPFSQEFQSLFYKLVIFLSFAPVLLGSIVGSYFVIKKKEYRFYPFFIIIFYFNFIHIITISSLRYRFPIENFLIILAVYGLFQLFSLKKNDN